MLISKPTWMVSVRCTSRETKLRVTERGDDLMKARLPTYPGHPRALMTVCEGLALWHGMPLGVAVSADADAVDCFERIFFGGDLFEPRSPLVVLEDDRRRDGRKNLDGFGEFRRVRLVRGER
ncbi:MAG: hypothetical protein ACREQQ_13880 [Candidatus Binatia bacterium]